MDDDQNQLIPISALNHFSYCPRRAYLIHVEREFVENEHTVAGSHEHARADSQASILRDGVRTAFGLPVASARLGLIGRCDSVEFHHHGARVVPVERKHGKRKAWDNDDLQLAGQAVCLEEMLGVVIQRGAIFHTQTARRREVAIDATLRAEMEAAVDALRALLNSDRLPDPTIHLQRCGQCSLNPICQPELARSRARAATLAQELFSDEQP